VASTDLAPCARHALLSYLGGEPGFGAGSGVGVDGTMTALQAVTGRLFARPEEADGNTSRFFILSNSLYLLFFLVHLCFIPLFLVLGIAELVVVNIVSAPIYVLVLAANLRGHYLPVLLVVTVEVVVHAAAASHFIGEVGIRQALIFNLILVILWPGRLAVKAALAGAVAALFVGLNIFDNITAPAYALHPWVFNGLRGSVAALEAFIAGYLAFYYLRAASAVERDLEVEIAERRTAQRRLAASEARIRAVMESVEDAVVTITPDGLIESANRAVERIFGHRPAELVGGNVSALMPAPVADEHDGHVARYLRTGEKRIIGTGVREIAGLTAAGEEIPLDLTVGEVDLGGARDGQTLFVGVMRDIRERKQAERQLQEAFAVITSSIEYASRIQRATLPRDERFGAAFADHFVLWQPRDVVGGDVYWIRDWGGGSLVILADCTGHGVPGAFMTLISTGALDRAVDETEPGALGRLVQRIHQMVQVVLGQHEAASESDDGLELGAVHIAAGPGGGAPDSLTYTGARFELFVARDGAVEGITGTRSGIGYRGIAHDQAFEEVEVPLSPGAAYYLSTDGLIDQIGGAKRRSFGKRRLRALLGEIKGLPMAEQRRRIEAALEAHQGDERRRDDVSVIGFTLN